MPTTDANIAAQSPSETRSDQAPPAREANVLGEPIARDANGRWLKGSAPNPLGRIKKRPTVLDETIALAERSTRRRRIARAWVATMEEAGTAAGNRARADFSDRAYGLPKQTLVIQQGESPADALDARLAQLLAGPVVDGEARELPADSEA